MNPKNTDISRLARTFFITTAAALAAACGTDSTERSAEQELAQTDTKPGPVLGSDKVLEAPQYIAVRKTNTAHFSVDPEIKRRCVQNFGYPEGAAFHGNEQTCVVMTPGIVAFLPDRKERIEVIKTAFREVRQRIGVEFDKTSTRQLATQVIIATLSADIGTLKVYLEDIVTAARAVRMPLLVAFDTVNWAAAYPALWTNEGNYELAGPDANHLEPARIAWRNWAKQGRVGTPSPNLHSAAFRQANAAVLAELLPVLRNYGRSLSPDEQHLFGGVILGTEISIGVNHYYYPNGNRYETLPAECDPGSPYAGCDRKPVKCSPESNAPEYNIQCPPSFANGDIAGGLWQLGYRALRELATEYPNRPEFRPDAQGRLTKTNLDAIVRDYLSFLNHQVRIANDMPTHKVFVHAGGTWGHPRGPHSLGVARFGSLIPGWSLYANEAADPASFVGHDVATPANIRLPWSSPEWLRTDREHPVTEAEWTRSLDRTANYFNNRLVSVGNWESISDVDAATSAVRTVVQAINAPNTEDCAATPRVILGMTQFADGVALRLSGELAGSASYLLASDGIGIDGSGHLSPANVLNTSVTGLGSRVVPTRSTPTYVQVVTDGCAGDGREPRRVFSPIYAIAGALPSSLASYATGYPRIYARPVQGSGITTLAWELDPSLPAPASAMVQIATNPSFAPIDVASYPVNGSRTLLRSFTPGVTYYARLSVGSGFSNTLRFTPSP